MSKVDIQAKYAKAIDALKRECIVNYDMFKHDKGKSQVETVYLEKSNAYKVLVELGEM